MMKIMLLVLILTFTIIYVGAKDLLVGQSLNEMLISSEKVEEKGILYLRRHKDYVYEDPKQRIIIGLIAYDLLGQGEATVTEGGVGYSFVKLHLKSGRSEDLNYMIQIFTKSDPNNFGVLIIVKIMPKVFTHQLKITEPIIV